MEREFNLIDEPWICVKTPDQRISEVGLLELFKNVHNYTELAGETKAQDFAVLRFLLAVMHTVFSRYDLNGDKYELEENRNLPRKNWKEMWRQKRIAAKPVECYFKKWYDRFWLFDEECPFYQSTAVKGKNKPTPSAKMIGTLFESSNKNRIFSERCEDGRLLSYAEAARWLLHLNCFDDIAAKKPTPKRPWVGRLGLIALKGKTLAETILLNYAEKYDVSKPVPVYEQSPSWEQDNNISEFNRIISIPDNQAALLSLMSRRIWLCRDKGGVSGYNLSGGDYFEDDEVFDEQMTLWRGYQEKKDSPYKYKPKLYDQSKQIWREFGSIVALGKESSEQSRCAGIISRVRELRSRGMLEHSYMVKIITTAVIYDYKQATSLPVIDVISDSLTFHSQLLEELGANWRNRINIEITKCDDAAKSVWLLYKELQYASGRKDKDGKTELSGEIDAKVQFYEMIDRPFRMWLADIDPESDPEDGAVLLENELYRISLRLGEEYVSQSGAETIFGRGTCSSAKSLNKYISSISKIFNMRGEINE